jgi:hypothetical protein
MVGIVLAATVGTGWAQDEEKKTPRERLRELEKEMEELKKEFGEEGEDGAAKREPETVEEDAPTDRISALSRIVRRTRVGGYFDFEYFDFRHDDSHFDQHRLIVQLSSYLHERLFFNSEIEYEHGAGEIKVEQAYLDFLIHDAINFRAGVVLVPLGKLNLLHDSDYRDLTLRPLTETYIIPSTWMEDAAGFWGSLPLGPVSLNWEAYVTQGLTADLSLKKGLRDARPSLEDDNNSDKSYCARLELVAFDGHLTVGTAGYRGRFDDDGHETVFVYAADATISVPMPKSGGWFPGPLELRMEAARFTADDAVNGAGADTPPRGAGAFAQLSFHFFPPFLKESFLGAGFDNPAFTLVALWDAVQIDDPNTDRWNHQRRLSFGLNFRPIEQVAFKVEYVDEDSDTQYGNVQQDGWVASVAVGF